MSALVFLDTETTGLSLDDDIWEVAAIRREADGSESRLHLFIEHDSRKCAQLPESFRIDHQTRFPACGGGVVDRARAASRLVRIFEGKPHVVGAVPNFDTERIARFLGRFGWKPGWHYHLIDVEALAVGYLCGVLAREEDLRAQGFETDSNRPLARRNILPWDSDELSRACGVEPPGQGERHTAMGDAEWAMRLYDAIVTGEQP